ncbi:PLC-like phosphodiesterase [Lyophyllum atratum]|nr:PLC-like phosphodiesterase [Lyophyllum atratum]
MALHGWPISQCQELTTPLAVQLQSGIRVIDIRLAIVNDRLIAYHGIYPQRTPFQEMLSTIHDFLTSSSTCRETIVMSIKQEDFAKNSYLDFSRLVHEEIYNGPGGQEMWYLRNRVPSLGEVRGKVVLFSRFGGNGEGWEDGWEGLGMHPLHWPDSEKFAFSWQCKETLVRIHDWYKIPSFLAIPEKVSLAAQILLPPPNNPPMPTLSITFLSASSFPLAMPPTVAKGFGWPKLGFGIEGVNSRFAQWILNNLAGDGETVNPALDEKVLNEDLRIRGWALMDFYNEPESALTPLLVECNYRGRRKGEEGW